MGKIVDYLAEEEAELKTQQAKRVNMTEQQRLEYKVYRAACRMNNVEPVRADFLAGDIPSCVTYHIELEQNEVEWSRRTMAAACGA
jgi:hypothetical protein